MPTRAHTLDPQLKALARAARKLCEEQGPRARRNARAAVRKAARQLLYTIDGEYPAPARKVRKTRKPLDDAMLRKRGWQRVEIAGVIAALHAAGAATRTCGPYAYARVWAVNIHMHCTATELRAAVHSPKRRAEILGRLKLEGKIP